ncbi:MAG: hypothetical protein DRN15_10500 [Thermoprotei archaeon]|nr:MAG: hypothetical protein DRN15_10500 [Thermoprotei archaeon]
MPLLERLTCRFRMKGPKLLTLLLFIKEEGPVGRYRASQALGVSEGVMRGLLKRMAEDGIVQVMRAGVMLTPKGQRVIDELLSEVGILDVKEVDLRPLSPGKLNVVAHIKRCGDKVTNGMRERDTAVRHGAEGAIIMVVKRNRLEVPSVYDDLKNVYPDLANRLFSLFKLNDRDVLVATFDNDRWLLIEATIAVAIELKETSS